MILRSPRPLLTNDRPIVLLDRATESRRGVGVGTATLISFALDRRKMLVMNIDPEPREGIADCSPRFAMTVNQIAATSSRRWIYHHPEDRPLDDLPFRARCETASSRDHPMTASAELINHVRAANHATHHGELTREAP